MIIAGVLLVAGVIAVFAAKRRAGWAALLIVPLLLGGAFLGAGAPSAQAAGVPCPVATETATPVVTETPTPTPEPTCTPTAAFDDIVVGPGDDWSYRSDDGFDGFYLTYSDPDPAKIAALLAVSTSANPLATVTASGTDFNTQDPVAGAVTFTTPTGFFGPGDFLRLSTDEPFLYVPWQLINEKIEEEYGVDNSFFINSLSVVIAVPYSDGCGGTLTATITFDRDLPPAG
jgi:hypothetical protein